MNEIKAPLFKKILSFIYAHLIAIELIIIGIVVFFSSCGKANASEVGTDYEDFLTDQCEKYNIDYSEIGSYLTDYPYIISFDCNTHFIALFLKDYSTDVNNYLFPCFFNFGSSISNYIDEMKVTTEFTVRSEPEIASVSVNNSYECLYLTITNNSYNLQRLYNYTSGGTNNTQNSNYFTFKTWYSYPSSRGSQRLAYRSYSYSWYYYKILAGSDIYTNTDSYLGRYYANLYKLEPNIGVEYTEDNRLKMTIVNDAYGNKMLLTDVREFINDFPIQDTSASSNELDNDTIILTVVKDLIPETITLNASNSNITDKYIFRTPLSVFNIDESDDVYISDVSFSISGSGQSVQPVTESYNILTEFYLKQSNIRPSEDVIPKDTDVEGAKLTQVEYDNVKDKVNFSNGYYSPLGGGGNELVVPYGYNVLYVTITGSRTIASIVNEMITDNFLKVELPTQAFMDAVQLTVYLTSEIKKSITGITSTDDAEAIIRDYVKNNYYTNAFDIVVYYWAPDASLGEPDVMYYYLTESGRIRGISQILADLYKETNQVSVNTKATYEYLYDKLNDFESMTLEAIWGDSPFSIFSSVDKLDNHLLTGITQIIDAMPTYEPYNDSTVTSLLGDITTLLAEIIHNQESPTDGYPRYISWIKEFNDLDGFGNWSDSVLDTFKNIYSFFNYRTDINIMETGIQTYITYINEYVDMLLGNTESSLEIESRYYMSIFDGTYDINNINGGGN